MIPSRGLRRLMTSILDSILSRRMLLKRSWTLPTTTGETSFSFTVPEVVERPMSATPSLQPSVHRERSPFVSLLRLLLPFSLMVVALLIHTSKSPFPLMSPPHVILQRRIICMVSSKRQNLSYGMKPLCSIIIVQKPSTRQSRTSSRMINSLEASLSSLLVTSDRLYPSFLKVQGRK